MLSCRASFEKIKTITTREHKLRNFHMEMDMSDYLVETGDFCKQYLEAFSLWNLEKRLSRKQIQIISSRENTEDYRLGMSIKIMKALQSLHKRDKKAIITTQQNTEFLKKTKQLREIHFFAEKNKLNATAFFNENRACNFPRNIHFLGSLMDELCARSSLNIEKGSLYYFSPLLFT